MKLSPRYTLILTAVGVFLSVVVLAVVLVVPQFGKLADLKMQIGTADDQVQQAESLVQARQEAKSNAAFTDAALLELAAAVPENPDLPSLIIELQDVAYQSNVQLRRIVPGDMVQSTGYVIMPVEIEVWGEWTDSVDFVQQVGRLSRQVRIVQTTTAVLDEGDLEEALDEIEDYGVSTVLQLETYVIPAAADSQTGGGAVQTSGSAATAPVQ
jgi:Tfp pilus assembly protein PilO